MNVATVNPLGICPTCNAQPCTCPYAIDPHWVEKIQAAVSVFEIAAAAGYRLERTGGNCEGLTREFPPGLSCLITAWSYDAPAVPVDPTTPCDLGVYDAAGDLLEAHIFPTLAAALAFDPWNIKNL